MLTSQQVKQGTATTHLNLSYDYTLTANGPKTGQLTKITDLQNASRSKAYVYDKLGRLQQAKGGSDPLNNPQWTQTYDYDRYGNRKSVSKSGPGSGSLPLDGLAALAYTDAQGKTLTNRVTTTGYSYDSAGNQTRGETESGVWRRYLYDAAGRLVTALADDGTTVQASYGYGAGNQRLQQVESGTTTYYAWGGGSVMAEYQEPVGQTAMQWDKSYVYLGGRLLATRSRSNGLRYHHPDRLGTRVVTDTAGNLMTEQVTLPYGTALDAESSGTATNRRFTSYDRSLVTKLDYAVNRFYNAGQGRFTQVDPIGMSAVNLEDPQTLNLYAYCGNDPINRIDPDGLSFFGWLGKAFKFLFKVATVVLVVLAVLVASLSLGASLIFLGVAGLTGLAGWDNGKLGRIAATVLSLGFGSGSYGSLRTPSTFPNGTGVSGVSSFLPSQRTSKGPDWVTILGRLYFAFSSFEEAAFAALDNYNPQSRRLNREFGGKICVIDSPFLRRIGAPPRFIFTGVRGTRSHVDPDEAPCPPGTRQVAEFHTHGANEAAFLTEIFSPDDKLRAN